ncbi:unnamed protein product [Trichobilharzia szidati]|nr:unnamed protein product [Trichobilharzia szidati]
MVLRKRAMTPMKLKSSTSKSAGKSGTPMSPTSSASTPSATSTSTPGTTPTTMGPNQPKSNFPNFKIFIEYCVEIDMNQPPFTSQHLDAPVSAKHGLVKFVNIDRSLLLMLTEKEMFLDKPLWWPGTTELCINYGCLYDVILSRADERKFALDIKSYNPGKRLIHVFSSVSRDDREKLVTILKKNVEHYHEMINREKAMQQQQATYYLNQANAQKPPGSYVDQTINAKDANVTPILPSPQKKQSSGRFSKKPALKSPVKPLSFEDFPHSSSMNSPKIFNFSNADCEAFGYSPTIYPVSHSNDSANHQHRNRSLSPTPLQCTTPEIYHPKPSQLARYPRFEEKANQADGPLLHTRALSRSQPQLAYPYDNAYNYQDEYIHKVESQSSYRSPGYTSHSPIVPKYVNSSASAANTPSRVVRYNDDAYEQEISDSKSIKLNGDDLVLKINCYNPENRSKSPGATHIVRISHGDDSEKNGRKKLQ